MYSAKINYISIPNDNAESGIIYFNVLFAQAHAVVLFQQIFSRIANIADRQAMVIFMLCETVHKDDLHFLYD